MPTRKGAVIADKLREDDGPPSLGEFPCCKLDPRTPCCERWCLSQWSDASPGENGEELRRIFRRRDHAAPRRAAFTGSSPISSEIAGRFSPMRSGTRRREPARRGGLVLERLSSAMGQHPKSRQGDGLAAATRMGTGCRREPANISGTQSSRGRTRSRNSPTCTAKPAALVFTSGYVSNQTGDRPLLRKLLPDCLIMSDAMNHNSMIEGVSAIGERTTNLAFITMSTIWRRCLRAAPAHRPKADRIRKPVFDEWRTSRRCDGICDLAERHGAMTLSRRGFMRVGHVRAAWRPALPPAEGRSWTAINVIEGTHWRKRSAALGGYIAGSAALIDAVRLLFSGASSSPAPCHLRSAPPLPAAIRPSQDFRSRGEARSAAGFGPSRGSRRHLVRSACRLMPSDTHIVPLADRRSAKEQGGKRSFAGPTRHLHPAHQLSDSAKGKRTPSHHPDAPVTTNALIDQLGAALADVWTLLALPLSQSRVGGGSSEEPF